MAERLFATLECERVDRRIYHTPTEARLDPIQFLEGWYNPHRRHSALGNRSPNNLERAMMARAA